MYKYSVIIPLYNKEKYIKNTILSVLNSLGNESFEIIVVDDGSTDNSVEEVRNIRDERIVYIKQDNQGPSSARNNGILNSNGEFILFIDADDIMLSSMSNFLNEAISKYPEYAVYCSNYKKCTCDFISEKEQKTDIDIRVVDNFFKEWRKRMLFCASSVCIRRSFIMDYDLFFPIGEYSGEDQYVWFKMAGLTKIVYTETETVLYRIGLTDSLTTAMIKKPGPHIEYLKKIINNQKNPYIEELYNDLYFNVAVSWLLFGLKTKAFKYIMKNPKCLFSYRSIILFILGVFSTDLLNSFYYRKRA